MSKALDNDIAFKDAVAAALQVLFREGNIRIKATYDSHYDYETIAVEVIIFGVSFITETQIDIVSNRYGD